MCARFSLTVTADTIADIFGVQAPEGYEPAWNIAPTQQVTGIVHDRQDQRLAWQFRWGLIPHWATDLSLGARMINARSETVQAKPSFREPWRTQRMLVLADSFYEWRKEGEVKQPYQLRRKDGRPFAMAGLYSRWRPSPDEPLTVSCTILTTTPNPLLAKIHDRMPVILDAGDFERWMARSPDSLDELHTLLGPCDDSEWEAIPLHRRIGQVRAAGPECVEPIGPPLS